MREIDIARSCLEFNSSVFSYLQRFELEFSGTGSVEEFNVVLGDLSGVIAELKSDSEILRQNINLIKNREKRLYYLIDVDPFRSLSFLRNFWRQTFFSKAKECL